MARKEKDLFCEYKRQMEDAGIYHPRLDAQIRAAALTEQIINRISEELNEQRMSVVEVNVKGTPSLKDNALLTQLSKYLTIQGNQLRQLGLNYDATPSKITDSPTPPSETKRGGIASALGDRQMNFTKL